jgi:hypothetical protein
MSDETTPLDMDGLKGLADGRFFADWEDSVAFNPPEAVAASQAVMQKTVHKLLELGPVARIDAVMAVLRECIEAFNDLDTHWGEGGWICTLERDDILEEFYRVVELTGMGYQADLDDGTIWRDW